MKSPRTAVGSLVLLDANILYPIRLCDCFLTAGVVGLIAKPVVSEEILAEAQRNVTADRADLGEARVKRRFDAVRTVTSGADDPIPKRYLETRVINDKDRHVLAAARLHSVNFVVTNDDRLRRELNRWVDEQRTTHLAAALAADDLVGRFVDEHAAQVRAVVQSDGRPLTKSTADFRRRSRWTLELNEPRHTIGIASGLVGASMHVQIERLIGDRP